jgi:hypothetical protein
MEFGSIIISETAVNSENPQDVINSNISVINLMREENWRWLDSRRCVDELLFRLLHLPIYRREFCSFVYSRWNAELNELIEEGLQLLGAEKHLELFQQQCKKSNWWAVNEINSSNRNWRRKSNTRFDEQRHFWNRRKLSATQSFLKSHPDLEVLSVDDMFATLEEFVTRLKGHR